MTSLSPSIMWFRQDLRLADNPALTAAVESGAQIIPLYILDDASAGEWRMGGAARVWLHHSLAALNQSLDGNMVFLKGDAKAILPDLIEKTGAQAVYWNRCYEPWRIQRDQSIKEDLKSRGIQVQSFNGSLLWEPWDVLKDDGTPYKVFTPFYRKGCLGKAEPRLPLAKPENIKFYAPPSLPPLAGGCKGEEGIDDLKLLPQSPIPRWDVDMVKEWTIGEAGAQQRLNAFLSKGLNNYKEGRNIPAGHNVSRLSPHLHFGEVSPNQVWYAAKAAGMVQGLEKDLDHFLSELGWREFSHSLLYHFPTLPRQNLQGRFDAFPWRDDPAMLHAWQRGETGYPIVDAAMRELYQTGYMHNRTRMIVGSFLVKNLLLHWHHGEDWFWDCLFDADLANNAASWQWVAGCGADAAPYFRIFNPITQGEKFDPDGAYIRKFVPELKNMPNDFIHKPWEASPLILKAAGVDLGTTYPHPIIDHAGAREKALAAFEVTKNP